MLYELIGISRINDFQNIFIQTLSFFHTFIQKNLRINTRSICIITDQFQNSTSFI